MKKTILVIAALLVLPSCSMQQEMSYPDVDLSLIEAQSETLEPVDGVKKIDLEELTKGVKPVLTDKEAWSVVNSIAYPSQKKPPDEEFKKILRIVASEPSINSTLDAPFNNLIQKFYWPTTDVPPEYPNREIEVLLLAALANSKKEAFHGGLQHVEHVRAMHASQLGKFYIQKRRYKEAEPVIKEALQYYIKSGYSTQKFNLKCNLLISYLHQDKFDAAEPLYKWLMNTRGYSHILMYYRLKEVATHYLSVGKEEQASALLAKALQYE